MLGRARVFRAGGCGRGRSLCGPQGADGGREGGESRALSRRLGRTGGGGGVVGKRMGGSL